MVRSSSKFSWRIPLSPKTLGEIQVAPIQVGNEQTPPLTLTVAEVPEGAQGARRRCLCGTGAGH
jgi:hypothetical protein